jgi:hypothetical protein
LESDWRQSQLPQRLGINLLELERELREPEPPQRLLNSIAKELSLPPFAFFMEPHKHMGELVDERKEAAPAGLFLGVDDDYWVGSVRKTEAAPIILGEGVVQNEYPLILDPLAADDIELASVLGLGLVFQGDVEILPGAKGEGIHFLVVRGSEVGKVRDAFAVLRGGVLDAQGELDGVDGFSALGRGSRTRRAEVGQRLGKGRNA